MLPADRIVIELYYKFYPLILIRIYEEGKKNKKKIKKRVNNKMLEFHLKKRNETTFQKR
jgi:hypothetical protein